jgi:hypothetical protein
MRASVCHLLLFTAVLLGGQSRLAAARQQETRVEVFATPPVPSVPQVPAVPPIPPVVSNEVSISRDETRLRIEMADGRSVNIALRGNRVLVDGSEVGSYMAGDALDLSWRSLLRAIIDTPTEQLITVLGNWQPPSGPTGQRLAAAIARQLPAQPEAVVVGVPNPDTLARLQARIQVLDRMVRELEGHAATAGSTVSTRAPRQNLIMRPLQHLWAGIVGVLSVLMMYLLLLAIGFAVVFFGRKHLEGVADTVRHATVRSGLVGLAATFLILPAFVVGIVALAITILGIPLLLLWIPLFPLALVAALLFGYLAVAHAAGEALAERRLYGGEWVKANSYYFLGTGLALFGAPFLASQMVRIGGPWFNFLSALLVFVCIVVTWIAFSLGLGAVLLSRAGTRPIRSAGAPEPDLSVPFEEGSHV